MALTLESTTHEVVRNPEWRDDAACNNVDTNLFFPVGVTGPAIDHIARAKAVCAVCPVASQCLEFALVTNQEYGVWGGTAEEERRSIRRAWRARQRAARAAAKAS